MEALFAPLELWQLALLLAVSVFAGVLTAISGGGGMVTVPLMMLCGVPPITAIAINKFQAAVGMVASIHHYRAQGLLRLGDHKLGLILAAIAAAVGVFVLRALAQAGWLDLLIPVVLIAVALYSALPDRWLSTADATEQDRPIALSLSLGGIGLWGGAISVGTGPILLAVYRLVTRAPLQHAITQTKPTILVVTFVSLSVLIWLGVLWWALALAMAAGNALGTRIGTRMVLGPWLPLAQAIAVAVPIAAALSLLLRG